MVFTIAICQFFIQTFIYQNRKFPKSLLNNLLLLELLTLCESILQMFFRYMVFLDNKPV